MEEAFSRMVNVGHYKFFGAGLAEALFDAGRVTDALALVGTPSIPDTVRRADNSLQKSTGSGACS
jgi:hypothetical protein